MIAAILFMIFALYAMVGQEWIHGIRRSRTASQITKSYRTSALAGEVALPATNADAIQCWSMCFWSMPTTVRVKTASGDTFIYNATQVSNSSVWKFIQFEPPTSRSTSRSITNAPTTHTGGG